MVKPLTQKQESFCQKYIETGNASEAYRFGYNAVNMKPEVIHVKACELLKSGNVSVRVKQLQEEAAERNKVTVDDLVRELEEARELAKGEAQAAPMVSATMGKGKLLGLIVDKAEQKLTHSFEDYSDDELALKKKELERQLGRSTED